MLNGPVLVKTRHKNYLDKFMAWPRRSKSLESGPGSPVSSVQEPCADSQHHRLCESYRCGGGGTVSGKGQFHCGSYALPEASL